MYILFIYKAALKFISISIKSIKLSFCIIFLKIYIKLSWISLVLLSVNVCIISSNISIRLDDISTTLLDWSNSIYLDLALSLSDVILFISNLISSKVLFNKFLDSDKCPILFDKLDISLIYWFKDSSSRLVFNLVFISDSWFDILPYYLNKSSIVELLKSKIELIKDNTDLLSSLDKLWIDLKSSS